MWVTIFETYFYYTFLLIWVVQGHLPAYVTTPANKVDQYCDFSEECVHDTIPVCAKMGDEKRSFLDFCDMMEFICDTSQIFIHIDDEEGCPADRKPNL